MSVDTIDVVRAALIQAVEKDETTMRLFEAARLAEEFMRQHGLTMLGWKFGFDRAKARCGVCRFGKKRIQMSKYYILSATAADIEDTILHEIAHALVGASHNHDLWWRLKAKEIGARPKTCSTTKIKAPSQYTGRCADCGESFTRHKKLRPYALAFSTYRHSPCRHKQNRGTIIWSKDGKELNKVTPTDKPFAGIFAEAAQTALEGTGIKVVLPTQGQINDLWARLNKLEGKS